LPFEKVQQTLSKYDVLLLPTFYAGEGYPGAIIEAYSCGIPVIATAWRSIPEIVHKNSGILIPPHSSAALANAIDRLSDDAALYRSLSNGALAARDQFSSGHWQEQFVTLCERLVPH
jgi:glycosyltransferase involved in cell wall biosynthesis